MSAPTESTLLAIVFLLYFAAAFVWPTLRVWRISGKNPYVLPSSDDVYGFVTRGMRIVMMSLLAYVMLQAVRPDLGRYIGDIASLATPALRRSDGFCSRRHCCELSSRNTRWDCPGELVSICNTYPPW